MGMYSGYGNESPAMAAYADLCEQAGRQAGQAIARGFEVQQQAQQQKRSMQDLLTEAQCELVRWKAKWATAEANNDAFQTAFREFREKMVARGVPADVIEKLREEADKTMSDVYKRKVPEHNKEAGI